MKYCKNWLWMALCLLLCVGLLAACGDDTPAETTAQTTPGIETQSQTDTQTNADIQGQTQAPAEETGVVTEAQTAEVTVDTTVVTEAQTEAQVGDAETETQAPETTEAQTQKPGDDDDLQCDCKTEAPAPLNEVFFSDVAHEASHDASKFTLRPNQTAISFAQDAEEGTVLALSTQKLPSSGTPNPYVYLNYEAIASFFDELNADTLSNPHMVLKVKNVSLSNLSFSLYAYPSTQPSGVGAVGEQKTRLHVGDQWQYIYFDLSSAKKELKAFRFDYENFAKQDGETMYISEIKFLSTKEEAIALAGEDIYEVKEQTADDYTLHVMSFNVQTETGTSVLFDTRADMLRDLIDEYMPDSIGMQEVTPTWRKWMDTYVFNGSYTGVGEARTNNVALGLEQSCIFYRSDKFDLLDSGTFWLSATPDVVGSMVEGANYPRICTYVHLRDKATGLEYIHMNTHLDHDGNNEAKDARAIRLAQATVMLQKLHDLIVKSGKNIPFVITGDFNQRAVSPSSGNAYDLYKMLTGLRAFTLADGTEYTFEHLADSRMEAPDNMPEDFTATMTTYHDATSSKYNPARGPIDYCFYSKDSLQALSYAIRLYDRNGTYLSDHLPVITTFKFIPQTTEETA